MLSAGSQLACIFLFHARAREEKMSRKQRSDSTSAVLQSFKNAIVVVQPPDGISLRTDDERVIWDQFAKARSVDDWRDFDLVLLAKVVRLEADIRRYQEMLDNSGPLIKNKRDTLVENPLLRVVDTLQRQQLALIRSMSLNTTGQDPRTLNENGRVEDAARKTMQNNGIESLLAMPIQ